MQKSHECFLALCNTMHFTRAAEHLHITQQALSDQIRRLEIDMNTQLFVRKPKLALTPAGHIFHDFLLELSKKEREMTAQLNELREANAGTINIGIHSARALIVFSPILEEFHNRYPNITINTISAQTVNYIGLLESGIIDFYLGINATTTAREDLTTKIIAKEPLYLVVYEQAFNNVFPDDYNAMAEQFRKSGADISLFRDIPFVVSGGISQARGAIEKYMSRKDISIKRALIYEDYAIQFKFLPMISGASFTFKSMLKYVEEYNSLLSEGKKLLYFPLEDFQEDLYISLTHYKNAYMPNYTHYLYKLIEEKYPLLV